MQITSVSRRSLHLAATIVSLAVLSASLHAQSPDPRDNQSSPAAEAARQYSASAVVKTYYLNNVVQREDAIEIQTALRNMLDPRVRVYLVTWENAISVDAPPDQQRLAEQLIQELDRARKAYRLTYTITEVDGGKRVGVQHFSMMAVIGQRTTLKQGSKIPVITGTVSPDGGNSVQQQFQYLDIGMNFNVNLDQYANGVRLQSKVEQSSVAEEKAGTGALAQEPIVRQTVLEGTSFLTPGKPVALGSIDVVGTTRHIDVEVMMEPVA